jgi:hypothetical protein
VVWGWPGSQSGQLRVIHVEVPESAMKVKPSRQRGGTTLWANIDRFNAPSRGARFARG